MVNVQDRPATAATRQVMTGGQALVASLIAQGIDTVFALPGVQLDGAFDALYDAQRRGDIRVIHPRHEQAAAYMADGYARATGRIGTCMVVPGPGLLNAAAALSTAYACNTPVLCVTGQIQSDLIEFGRGQLHEIPNQLGMIRSVTKHSARATSPAAIPALVDDAVRAMWSDRARPVEIEIPPDTLFASSEITLLDGVEERTRVTADPDAIKQAARLLGAAESPLIYSGGGTITADAVTELRALAELLQAPVVMSANGKGAISERHYLGLNGVAGKSILGDADVVLAVGTRFVEPSTYPWGLKHGRTVIQIDVDHEEIGRNYPVAVKLLGDARLTLASLADAIGIDARRRPSREAELTAIKAAATELTMSVHPQADFGMAIRHALPDDGIFVGEMTQVAYWGNMGFPVYKPRTYLTPGYQGTLGWGYPTSLGVKVGAPDRVVVSINGDGGFGFALNELATQARHNIASITIVFNDNAYGNVRRIQAKQFNGRTIASDLLNPDYRKLADAFGVAARRAESPQELRTQLHEAIRANEPTLIQVPVEAMPDAWEILNYR